MKFDIKLAKQGKPVCNRLGNNVRIICFDKKGYGSIIALHECNNEELAYIHDLNGEVCTPTVPHEYDLLMKGEKRKMWVNVYNDYSVDTDRSFGSPIPYTTEKEAKNNINYRADYIATVPVEWEE